MEWISVKDRLPDRAGLREDESDYVLVAYKAGNYDYWYTSICGYTKDGWDPYDNFGYVPVSKIEYWMPMPTKEEYDGMDKR